MNLMLGLIRTDPKNIRRYLNVSLPKQNKSLLNPDLVANLFRIRAVNKLPITPKHPSNVTKIPLTQNFISV